MADAIALPQSPSISLPSRFLRLVPGVALLAVIGYAGKLLEKNVNAYAKAHHWIFPNIEYVLWAILLGLVISNVFGLAAIFKPGVATYEFWLKAGIVLLGARFLLGDVWKLGGVSLLLVGIEILGAIAFMTFLGRLFGLRPKLTTLLAVGSAVCGVSAIIATKGAIDADDEDSSFAIAAILALGAIALFTFPLKLAVLTKTTRNALIGFVVLAYAIYWASRGQAETIGNKAAFLWQKFPKFVLGFLLISALATAGFFNKDHNLALANLSRWAFLLTFAGVGLRTNFREMRKQGLRPFAVGFIGEIAIAAFTLVLVIAAGKLFGF
jgi:uncharacterized membrane protein YadS